MPQQAELDQIQLEAKGLFTNPNDLSKMPPGALVVAKNVVVDRPGVVSSRRGMKRYGTSLNLGADGIVDKFYNYQSTILFHQGTKFKMDSDGAGTWTAKAGTYNVPSGAYAVHAFQSNKNFYAGTAEGLYKLDAIASAFRRAGVPQGLDGQGSTTGSGWFANSTQVAYRIVWGYVDANQNTILGAPSERIIVANNSGGATNVSLAFTIPANITTSYFYQVYRSPVSIDLSTPPNDECQLIIQANPTAGQITAKQVTLTDSIPDSLKGATIYTAASQQGINQANYEPPIAVDMDVFKNFVFYGNVKNKQNLNLSLLAIGGGSGLVNGDTITVAGTVYTGQAAENAAIGQFKISSGGTPAQNIEDTAKSLIHVINTYASNTTVYAYYLSGFNDLPGQIQFRERTIGGAAFTISVSRATAWYYLSSTSQNDNLPARVMVSKFQQPEAVPFANYYDIGSADQPIYRIIALRNSIFVFKADGVFRITGTDLSDFAVEPWDLTVILKGPESAVLLNNQIYCYTSQGMIAVSETGSSIISIPIENTLLEISADQYTTFPAVTYGISYESDRKYIMNTVSATSNTTATQAFNYNYITNTFTQWVFPVDNTTGFVNVTDNRMYIASGNTNEPYVYKERKSFTSADYAEGETVVNIVSAAGASLLVTDSTGVEVDDTIQQGLTTAMVTAVPDGTHITVDDSTLTWAAGSATAYHPIEIELQYAPIHAGNPTLTKLFKDLLLYFSTPDFTDLTLSASTNFSQDFISWSISPLTLGNYGEGAFGTGIYGGTFGGTQPIRTWMPIEMCRAHWINLKITHAEALKTFELNGVSVFTMSMSPRFR